MEKTRINRAKLLLNLKQDIEGEDAGHSCCDCNFTLESDEKACEAVDYLEELESSLPLETKQVLVYIAGYVTYKNQVSENELLHQTNFYHQKYGQYTDSLDRGGLNIPSDRACQWTFFAHIVFNTVRDSACRKSFTSFAMTLSHMFKFEVEARHARILSNIFFKNYCRAATIRSTKEPALKRLNLSETA